MLLFWGSLTLFALIFCAVPYFVFGNTTVGYVIWFIILGLIIYAWNKHYSDIEKEEKRKERELYEKIQEREREERRRQAELEKELEERRKQEREKRVRALQEQLSATSAVTGTSSWTPVSVVDSLFSDSDDEEEERKKYYILINGEEIDEVFDDYESAEEYAEYLVTYEKERFGVFHHEDREYIDMDDRFIYDYEDDTDDILDYEIEEREIEDEDDW